MSICLPSDIRLRSATEEDLGSVLHIRQTLGKTDLTIERLQSSWQSLNLEKQTQVAIKQDGQLIGYAELLQHRAAVFLPRVWVRADEQGRGIGTVLLQQLDVQARLLTSERPCKLLAQPWRSDITAQRLLEKAGYALLSTFQRMELQMTEPPPTPATIPGIEIRPIVLDRDELAVYEADEEAFLDERGKEPRTLEQWRRRFQMHTDHFDPTLWWVAWDGLEMEVSELRTRPDDERKISPPKATKRR